MSLVIPSSEQPSKERYSFSKLNSWWVCPYGWKLKYIDHNPGIGNAFSSYGTFVHSIMERYANGEIELWDLPSVYEWEFESSVPEKFPYNKYVVLKDTYYKQGLDFLKNFQGYDQFKILGVEKDFDIDIDDWVFNGIVDLIFEDNQGRLVVRDYKSKASFKSDIEKKEYARQLYLYSAFVKKEFGRYPDELQFVMFRKQKVEPIKFCQSDYEEAIDWARNTVKTIRDAFDFPPRCDQFYAENLCNHREYCDLKGKII